ncbi:hypothetical protein ACJMK2_009550 [Sinanodonta woodiana]|uniref:THD domain-containing protein n=1 Tax=Sinanodonta woodiana TaxID=1069815 RepID=A0ABD3VCJ8_SINWO
MESKQESHDTAQNCHSYEDYSRTFYSSDGSVDSGYQTKGCYHRKLISKKPHVKPRLGGNQDFKKEGGKALFLSHGTEIEHKCANRQSVLKLKCSPICLSMSFFLNILLALAVYLLFTTTIFVEESEEENLTAEDTFFDIISTCGFMFCCVRNAAIHIYFTLVTTTNRSIFLNNANVDKTKNKWRSREVAAHLYVNITLTWRTDVEFGSAILSGIALTKESSIMVPPAGYYFIYSVVTFKCQHNSKTHIHLITRQQKGRPNAGVQQLLLRKSSECATDGFYTSFLSGVLQLKSNDEISVTLTKDSISKVYASWFLIFVVVTYYSLNRF